jgi:hypothetical protein
MLRLLPLSGGQAFLPIFNHLRIFAMRFAMERLYAFACVVSPMPLLICATMRSDRSSVGRGGEYGLEEVVEAAGGEADRAVRGRGS